MIVFGPIKELTVGWVQLVVILRKLDIKVLDPAQLSIDVSLLRELRIIWHSRSFNLILIIWIKLSLWINHNMLFILKVLVKVQLTHHNA